MLKEYELDSLRSCTNGHHEIIGIITGCHRNDIKKAAPEKNAWCGKDYINTFRKLGFNTNNSFINFDPETKHPVMMRFSVKEKPKNKTSYWHAYAYFNGKVYFGAGEVVDFDTFIDLYKEYSVTSMLQVWI